VVADVKRLRSHPLVPAEIPISGMIYDVHSGRLLAVSETGAIGAPMQQARSRAA
jgi:carbonic anhydrase